MSQSLSDFVRTAGKLPVEEAVRATDQILSQLEGLHSRGDVHGAITPETITVSEDGVVTLGEASATIDELDLVAFTAPEVTDGQIPSRASDTYSVGCILSMLLTGRPPFTAPTVEEVASQHRTSSVVPPHLARFDVPVKLEDVVLRSMDKDPAARFSSAGHMQAALEAAMVVPTEVLAAATVERTVDREPQGIVAPTTNPIVWAGLGLLAVLAIIAAIAFASSRQEAQPTPTPVIITPVPTVVTPVQPPAVVVPPPVVVVSTPPQQPAPTAAPTAAPTPTPVPLPTPTP